MNDHTLDPTCAIYWCDTKGVDASQSTFTTRRFTHGLMSVIGNEEAGGAVSESILMFPIWDAFEKASA